MILSGDPKLDEVLEQALTASAALADELRSTLMRRLLSAREAGADTNRLVEIARSTIRQFEPRLADMLTDARVAGWLRGNAKVIDQLAAGGGKIPPKAPLSALGDPDLPPPRRPWMPVVEEAAKDLRERRLLTRADFDAASDALRGRAFTVAGLHSQEALEHVREGLWQATTEGTSLRRFKQLMGENVETSKLGPAALENVFRTGTGSAYANGLDRLANHPGIAERFPYRERLPIEDSRITELCDHLAHDGIQGTAIYRAADPVWQRTRPLSHYQCRCGVTLLTIEQAASRGIISAQHWLRTGQDPQDFVPMPDLTHLQGYVPNWRPGGAI